MLFVLAVVGALALPHSAAAAVVVYNEAVDGDAGTGFGTNPAPPVITLGGGVNEILGSVTFSNNPQILGDNDAFDLVVGAGQRILSISIATVLRAEGDGEFRNITWALRGDTTRVAGSTAIPTIGTPLFGTVLPVGEGTYRLASTGLGGSLTDDQYRIADYAISVDVEATPTPVPLPAGAGLLAASLGLLTVLRRRRT
jgi:hypothetical protein